MRFSPVPFMLVFILLPSLSFASPNKVPDSSKTCVACHAQDGNSLIPTWPKIAGQHKSYLEKMLKVYRQGLQGPLNEPTMYAVVSDLTDAEIGALSTFYASQKRTSGQAKHEAVSLGARLYRGGNPKTGVPACGACHLPKGEGLSLGSIPRLSGQHPEFIRDQLKRYQSGKRNSDPNAIMRDIAKRLTNEEIEAISQYVSGLH